MGRRINLADLADEEPLPDARPPSPAAGTRPVPADTVAANPLNTRDVTRDPQRIELLAESMALNGQLQSCAVVTRAAFLRIFPEHETAIGDARLVQVTGGRRRAAALSRGLPLKVDVMDALAASRDKFAAATASENLDRENLDPVEEARAVELVVIEAGTGKAAAAALNRTEAWVTQRRNLLKLIHPIQQALQAGEVPLRAVRDWHVLDVADQTDALFAWRKERLTAVNRKSDTAQPAGRPAVRGESARPSRTAAAVAIRRLGGSPSTIAESLRAELAVDELAELARLLIDIVIGARPEAASALRSALPEAKDG